MRDMAARMRSLKEAIIQRLVVDDVFGLVKPTITANVGEWAFETDDRKAALFLSWLEEEIRKGVLEVRGTLDDAWMSAYIKKAYQKGTIRTYKEALPPSGDALARFTYGTRESFLAQAFSNEVAASKLKLIFSRNYTALKGITDDVSNKLARVLTDGLIKGSHPREIAAQIVASIDSITKKRALVLARTEIIYAHAEGQLDAMERLGLEEAELLVEWAVGGQPCPLCAANNGLVFTIQEARGLIPLHPNCKCAWIPANIREWRKKYAS